MTFKMNLKAFASALAALALTVLVSWTFVDATSLARLTSDTSHHTLLAISALVR